MKKFSANPIITEQMIQTSFNCQIELRDRLEDICNKFYNVYTPDEIMNQLLDESLKRYGF